MEWLQLSLDQRMAKCVTCGEESEYTGKVPACETCADHNERNEPWHS